MPEQHNTPLTKEFLVEALLGLEQRLDAKWEAKLDSKLQRFATKDDLKPFATKDDLKPFATKDDLNPFATKDALRSVQVAVARLEGEMAEVKYFLKTEAVTKRDMEPYRLLAERALRELDAHRELRSTRGVLLGDVVEKVEDHERRLREIEGRN